MGAGRGDRESSAEGYDPINQYLTISSIIPYTACNLLSCLELGENAELDLHMQCLNDFFTGRLK